MAVRPFMLKIAGTTAILAVLTLQSPAFAQVGEREAQIVVDAETNEVLYENNAQASRRPASITKVMTLYLLFDALKRGSITWDDRIVFSRNASSQPPTKLFIGAGNSIPVQTAVEALVLRSANDVATAVAERLGGSEANFALIMTSKARELGMSSTTFRNASGLPNATQRTTAEDLARLAIAIHRDFPEQYHWFSAQQMSWNGQTITGHNHLMSRMAGMDGLKTGYTNASGFNLAATTQRNGRRIVTVVLGGANRFLRDDLVEALTESAFRELGIGATQFAINTTAYEINFRDSRDAADAAALIMDLPPRRTAMAAASTLVISRSGRRLGFERGPPTLQVANMVQAIPSRPIISRGTQMAQRDESDGGATDEGEAEVVRPANPLPLRAVGVRTPMRVVPVPTRVPVPFPNATQPVPVPPVDRQLREFAQVVAPKTAGSAPVLRGNVDTSVVIPETPPSQTAALDSAKTDNFTPSSRETSPAETQPTGEAAPTQSPSTNDVPVPTQMAELAQQDAASLSSRSAPSPSPSSGELNASVTIVEANPAPALPVNPTSEAAPTTQPVEPRAVQMAALGTDAVAQAQIRQAEANMREQARLGEAQAIETTRREAARVQAAAAARVLAERQANERRAERQVADARARTLKEKELRDTVLAERQAVQERAVAARDEERRQTDVRRARNARGTAIVQVGAFKDKDDANAAIAQFARFFPSFAEREVSSVSRRDGVWYRARFAGLGAVAAREACGLVSGRGGACQIVGD